MFCVVGIDAIANFSWEFSLCGCKQYQEHAPSIFDQDCLNVLHNRNCPLIRECILETYMACHEASRSEVEWCRGEDSNLHILADSRPSSVRVYQFHHHGILCVYAHIVKSNEDLEFSKRHQLRNRDDLRFTSMYERVHPDPRISWVRFWLAGLPQPPDPQCTF